jgi:poly(A) polymerase
MTSCKKPGQSLGFSSLDQELLRPIEDFAKLKKIKLYLVGGSLRDKLLGRLRENPDFDFCLKEGAIAFGGKLSRRIKAGFVILDQDHGACRLVKKSGNKVYTFDFTDFRGKTLEEDLIHRDFTINSIAVELGKVFLGGSLKDSLIDPCAGCLDLKKKLIRVCGKNSFRDDPLRILRAFSFQAGLGFRIDPQTLRLAKKEKAKLPEVSFERIRDELFKIFDTGDSYTCLRQLDKLGILRLIIPEIERTRGIGQGPYHHLDVWDHTLETLRHFEAFINTLGRSPEISSYLNQVISSQRKRQQLIKLAIVLHDIGKPDTLRRQGGKITFHGHERAGLDKAKVILSRLRLSNDEAYSIRTMILWHLRPGYLADNQALTKRAKFRYFRDSAQEAVSILLLSVADQRATRGRFIVRKSRIRHEKVCMGLMKEYFNKQQDSKPQRLINGNDLMRKFKLKPSVLIGRILSQIEELKAIGKIRTKEEALIAAGKLMKKRDFSLREHKSR